MIDRFPTVRFVVRRGRLLVWAAGALPVLAAFLGIGIEGWHWFWMAAASWPASPLPSSPACSSS